MESSTKQNLPSAAEEGSNEAGTAGPIITETFSLSSITQRLNEIERKVNSFDDRLKKLENKFKMGDKSVPSSNTENKNLQLQIVSLVKKMGDTQDKNMKEWREAQEIGKAMVKEEVVRLLREFHLIDQNVSTADVTDASNNENSGKPENQIEPCQKNAAVKLVTLTDSEEDSECKSPQSTSKSASNENHAANNQLQISPGSNSVPNFVDIPCWTIPTRLLNDEIDFHIKSGTKRVIIPRKNDISKEKLVKILTGLKELLELDIGQISWNVVKALTKLQLDSVVILHLNGIGLSDDNLKNILSKPKPFEPMTKLQRLNSLRVLTLAGLNFLTDKSLEYVAIFALNLKKLTLSSCDEFTDKGIAALVTIPTGFSVNLVELSLERCKRFTNLSLMHLVKCPNLQKLKLVGIPAMTEVEDFSLGRIKIGSTTCEVIINELIIID